MASKTTSTRTPSTHTLAKQSSAPTIAARHPAAPQRKQMQAATPTDHYGQPAYVGDDY